MEVKNGTGEQLSLVQIGQTIFSIDNSPIVAHFLAHSEGISGFISGKINIARS